MFRRSDDREPRKPRAASDLVLAEQVIIWGVRRCADGLGGESISAEFRRVFGAANFAGAVVSVCEIVELLSERGVGGLVLGETNDRTLTHAETILLRLVALAQRRAAIEFEARSAEIVADWQCEALVDAIERLAGYLEGADFTLPLVDGDPPRLSCDLEDATTTTETLTFQERLLLQGIRYWVAQVKANEHSFVLLNDRFAEHRVSAAVSPLNLLMLQAAQHALRMIDVRCFNCRNLSPDEARLLHAVAAAQRGEQEVAFEVLASWLPPSSVRLALQCAGTIGRTFEARRMPLPLRAWRFPELLPGQPTWEEEHRVLEPAALH